jgi:uncharacterized protein
LKASPSKSRYGIIPANPMKEIIMKTVDAIAVILLIIGGLNWLLVGLFSFDLVAAIFGELSILSRIIYILVGLSALWVLFNLKAIPARRTTVHTTRRV